MDPLFEERRGVINGEFDDTIGSSTDTTQSTDTVDEEYVDVAEEGVVKEDRDYSGMSHGILAVAAKADGEGMAQIAGMLGVDVGEYDLDDDGDLDDLYDDIETANPDPDLKDEGWPS